MNRATATAVEAARAVERARATLELAEDALTLAVSNPDVETGLYVAATQQMIEAVEQVLADRDRYADSSVKQRLSEALATGRVEEVLL